MQQVHKDFLPGTYVEILTKQRDDGKNFCGTIIGAAPNAKDTYIVEYHPGLDNGHHSGNELRIIEPLQDDLNHGRKPIVDPDHSIGT